MSIVINNAYEIGDVVYLKTDKEQLPRIVYCIKVYKNDYSYELACGTVTSGHYDFEISKEVDVLIKTNS